MVGTSATGRRSRRALAVSSRPISNPLRLSMPTSRMNSVEKALKLLVASRVPTRPKAPSERPAVLDSSRLEQRAADLLAAGGVPGGCRHHHAAVHQPGQRVDLAGVVAAVGHRHHHDGVLDLVDAVPDRVGRPAAVAGDQGVQPWFPLAVVAQHRHRGVFLEVDHDQDLALGLDRVEDPVQHRDDGLALVVGGNDDRDGKGHQTTVPCPSRFQTSATGSVVSRSRYCLCGAAMISRSPLASTYSSDSRLASTLT